MMDVKTYLSQSLHGSIVFQSLSQKLLLEEEISEE